MPVIHIQPFEAKYITIYPPFPDTSEKFCDVTVLMMSVGFVDFVYDRNDVDGIVHHRDCFSGPYHVEASRKESIYDDNPANRGV